MLSELTRIAPPARELPDPDEQQRGRSDEKPEIDRVGEANRVQINASQHRAGSLPSSNLDVAFARLRIVFPLFTALGDDDLELRHVRLRRRPAGTAMQRRPCR